MLITHGTLVTMGTPNELVSDGALYLKGEQIADLGRSAELEARYPHAERLDAAGRLVLPGLICAHTHFYGAFARGMALPGDPAANFPEILEKLWWRLDKALWPVVVLFLIFVVLVFYGILSGFGRMLFGRAGEGEGKRAERTEGETASEVSGFRSCGFSDVLGNAVMIVMAVCIVVLGFIVPDFLDSTIRTCVMILGIK